MTESAASPPSQVVELGGRMITFKQPTDGQMEMLARISRTLSRGAEDSKAEFWSKQIDRVGTLLDSLLPEADQEIVENLLLTGKINHTDVITALFKTLKQPEADTTAPAKPVASTRRARRI